MSDSDQGQSGDVFDVERIRRLVRLMEEHDLSEVDLRQQGERIKLRRGSEMVFGVPSTPGVAAMAPVPQSAASAPGLASTGGGGAGGGGAVDGPGIVTIKSPMVGTFYGRPNPDSEAFVKVGSRVSPETTVCIIEAMKTFTDIPAEVSGTVVAVLIENEQPVEFGKPLFKIDTKA